MAKTPEILLLGELALAAGGALPASKKTRALLGFLAVTKVAHTREELCDLLWQGPDDPRAALRWSLTKLRGVLGADAIEADRERVSLGKVTTDLDLVHGALAGGLEAAPLERLLLARELFRGELLEGLLLPDCYRFHQWSTAEREKARALRIAVLMALTARSQGAPERALSWARERVSVNPLAEGAHVEVIRLLTELGRKRDAIAQYDAFCRVLERELGARPSPALVEAKMKIGAPSVAAPARAEPVSARDAPLPASPALPALVGRETELEIIDRAARGDERGVVVVLGEPGIGKTRLLDELALRTRALGGTVLAGRAFEAEMVRPYGPWLDALAGVNPERVPETLREALGALLPALGSTSGWDCPVTPTMPTTVTNFEQAKDWFKSPYGYFSIIGHTWWVPRKWGAVTFPTVQSGTAADPAGWPSHITSPVGNRQPIMSDKLYRPTGEPSVSDGAGGGHQWANRLESTTILFLDAHAERRPVKQILWRYSGNYHNFY